MFETIIIYGITLTALYCIVAIGFSLLFGVADVINLSHGVIILASMYVTYVLVGLNWNLEISMLGGIIFAILILLIMYLGFMKRLLTAPHTSMLMLTAGMSYVISQACIILVGPDTKSVPSIFTGSTHIFGVVVSNQQILSIIIAAVLIIVLSVILQVTKIGRAIRAVTQDKDTASLYGINPSVVYISTVIITGALAGIAGALVAPLQAVQPEIGWTMMTTAFTITILSGLRAPMWGIVISAAIVAYAELLTAFFISPMLRDASGFLIMIFTLMFKPSGLFGRNN